VIEYVAVKLRGKLAKSNSCANVLCIGIPLRLCIEERYIFFSRENSKFSLKIPSKYNC